MVDVTAMIAAIVGADRTKYNYFAEMETAGKCLEWVRDHLAKDEIGIYVRKEGVPSDYEERNTSLYSYMTEAIKDVEPGSGGVIFAPWLHGNRCPFEDPAAKGMFFYKIRRRWGFVACIMSDAGGYSRKDNRNCRLTAECGISRSLRCYSRWSWSNT